MITIDRRKKLYNLIEKFYNENKEACEEAVNSGNKKEIYTIVKELIDRQLKEFDFTKYFFKTLRLNANDELYLEDLKKDKVNIYYAATGGYALHTKWEGTLYPVPKTHVIGSYEVSKLQAGNVLPTIQQMTEDVLTQLETDLQKYAVSVVRAATSTSPYLVETTLDDLAESIKDVIDIVADYGGGEVFILGRQPAISTVSDATSASEASKEEYEKYGIKQITYGAGTVVIPRIGFSQEALLDDNEVVVTAPTAGKFAFFGSTEKNEYSGRGFVEGVEFLQHFGAAITADLNRVYRVTWEIVS